MSGQYMLCFKIQSCAMSVYNVYIMGKLNLHITKLHMN